MNNYYERKYRRGEELIDFLCSGGPFKAVAYMLILIALAWFGPAMFFVALEIITELW